MYAVIRAGGKQYRVAPGDIIRVEKQATGTGNLEFELLAVGDNGKISRPEGEARVTGEILGEGRERKILVFHYKKKKQYKKLNGHRQPFTTVRVTEISSGGQTHSAPPLEAKKAQTAKAGAVKSTRKSRGSKAEASAPAAE